MSLVLLVLSSCQFKLKPYEDDLSLPSYQVQRYDRLESRYLTTGDFSALQQMNTDYPIETRTLIEKMLQLGSIEDRDIRTKFLMFYQDSTLQSLINDVETEYANMDDINDGLEKSFKQLEQWIPSMQHPEFYAQIGALDQSIVIGDKSVGISLDKYMGENYLLYKKYYNYNQRQQMTRAYIVPDCITFYLLSLYPLPNFQSQPQRTRDLHFAKMMWVANQAMGTHFFRTPYVHVIAKYMKAHPNVSIEDLLKSEDYSKIID